MTVAATALLLAGACASPTKRAESEDKDKGPPRAPEAPGPEAMPKPTQPPPFEELAAEPYVIGETKHGDLRLTLETRKRTWLLGENMVVHYVVRNDGATPAKISFGGDYRGGARAERVKVTAGSPDGGALDDPYPGGMNFGGLGAEPELAPGEEFAFTVSLHRYRRFEAAGKHSIRVAHDLGQTSQDDPIAADDTRWVEAELTVAVPTEAQAREVVRRMRERSSSIDVVAGKRAGAFADFSAMRHPHYLAPLREIADAEKRAFYGLAVIATVEATRAVIALAEHDDVEVAKQALEVLTSRMPLPPGRRDWSEGPREYLLERAWDADALGPDVHRLALKLLAANDAELVMAGAGLLAAVVEPRDLEIVTRELDRALESTVGDPIPYPEPATPAGELLRTATALLDQGATPVASPKTPGEIAVYVLAHGGKAKRPPEYASRARTWLSHPIPQVRVLVLRRTAAPVDASLAERLPELLGATHLGVQNAACDVLAAHGPVDGAPEAIVAQMERATDRWLVRCLNGAGPLVGVARDRMAELWVSRMDDPALAELMYAQLHGLCLDAGGGGMSGSVDAEDARRLQGEWRRFVAKHRKRIRAGRKLTSKDKGVPADLLPKGANLNARGGGPWLVNPRE